MERLGLWGEGAPFRTFEQFLDSVQRKGLGMAEMVAMEMKTSGMYVSRGLSFKQAEVRNGMVLGVLVTTWLVNIGFECNALCIINCSFLSLHVRQEQKYGQILDEVNMV